MGSDVEIDFSILLEDNFALGRFNLYATIVDYLRNIVYGDGDLVVIDRLKLIEGLESLVDEVKREKLDRNFVLGLRATNCLDLSEFEQRAYLENLESFYYNYGYEVSGDLPVDSLVTMLAFLGRLIRDSVGADEARKKELLRAQSRFIGAHLLNWLEKCSVRSSLLELVRVILRKDRELLLNFFREEAKPSRQDKV